jgi:mono/diheme cytochrome c family protein
VLFNFGRYSAIGGALSLIIAYSDFSWAADAPSTTAAAWFTRPQATRGRAVYREKCASCHADNMGGIGPAPPLAGGTFLAKWSASTVFDLFERVSTTMPQNAPRSLSDSECADIVAFILGSNNFPTGSIELTPDPKSLREMPLTGGVP